mmetsp:Transcript_12788/g.39264  ORF Transcript_12788/g.39264 Transcript_12788/m.39264 type:complete len:294 (+) Transcript_12788:120-1001(+)|eukprot:CAMPEP_0198727340 /NCGR_PEP_ID=MMETSP1475-20131203/4098_1 /TAXON_ID= ORGANISM="Unidentified sp., Strain CCMP1999" /NCGR_SAMPLE_ID=MMETSP1475 /ASSEMBLY_ACC=CAM_ASM_001111 /LENGTH=293 /DNA_ID=CAMNT_0044489369 /DNA_START=44 /DNA_END=925 /DNA_ORIENTATION=-
MGNGESSDRHRPPVEPGAVRPIRTGGGGNRGQRDVRYPEVSPYEANRRGGRTDEGKFDPGDLLLPFKSHWNASPIFELRYLAMQKGDREALKLGANLDLFKGRITSFLKYKYDDLRAGVRGAPVPDEAFGSIGVLGNKSNRLILTVGYNFAYNEPIIGFKVKSSELLRARVGGRSGAIVDSPAGLDYKVKVNLSPTSRMKAIGSLDLPANGVIFGEEKDAMHLAVNTISFKQRITADFVFGGFRDLFTLNFSKIQRPSIQMPSLFGGDDVKKGRAPREIYRSGGRGGAVPIRP